MIKYTNKIDTTNKQLIRLRSFDTRTKALAFMNEDKENRTFRDMNNSTNITMGLRWQVQVFTEVNNEIEVNSVVYSGLDDIIRQASNINSNIVNKPETKLRKGTKADQVRNIVSTMIVQDGIRTKDIINEIMTKVGFKQKAASTYFYNAKRTLGL